MITGKGIGFLIAAIALFLLGRLTQVGWLYLVDAVLWGIVILSAIFPWLGVAFITAHRRIESPNSTPASPGPTASPGPRASPGPTGTGPAAFPGPPASPGPTGTGPMEGDPVRITVSLGSRAFWPSYLLNVYYDCSVAPPEDRLHRFFVSKVSRGGQVSLESTVDAYQRGLHHLGPVVVESSAPFGLFRRRRKLTGTQPVLVYPQVHPMRRLAMAQGFSGMESQGKKARTGTDPLGARPYAPGDPRRNIHWRNSAKTGQLMVKELEDPLDRTAYLLFDATQVWGEGRETTLEYGIKLVASVAGFAHKIHLPVQVLGGGLSGARASHSGTTPGQGSKPWPRLLKELALVNPGDGVDIAENLAKLPPGSSVVAIVYAADRAALRALAKASSTLQTVIVVSLEGFSAQEAEPEMHADDLKSLHAAKIPVVPCRPGGLRQALDALGSGRREGKGKSFTATGATPNRAMAANGQIGDSRYHG